MIIANRYLTLQRSADYMATMVETLKIYSTDVKFLIQIIGKRVFTYGKFIAFIVGNLNVML